MQECSAQIAGVLQWSTLGRWNLQGNPVRGDPHPFISFTSRNSTTFLSIYLRKIFLILSAGKRNHLEIIQSTMLLTRSALRRNQQTNSDQLALFEPNKPRELPRWFSAKESAYQTGDRDLIPGSGRSLAEGNDKPLQYSCVENLQFMGLQSQTWLRD